MADADEYRRLRRRQDDLRERLDRRRPGPSGGTRSQLVQVFDGGHMPTTGNKFFSTHPVTAGGDEVEGGPGTFTVDTGLTIPVYFLGSRAPAVGDRYVARFLKYLWVAEGGKSSNPCKGHGNKITFNLVGCNGTPVAGATVNFILGGVTVLSTTTDASGNAVYLEPTPGTYTINWTFGALSGSKPATITSSCFDSAPSDSLLHVAPAGYTVCCPSCIWPLPSVIHLTDSNTTVPLIWNNSLSQPGWEQIYIVRVGVDGQSTYKIHYLLQCDGTFIQVFDGEFPGRDSPNCTGAGGSGTIPIGATDHVSVNVGSLCNYPFQPFSGTWPATGPCGYDTLASGPFSGTS